MSSALVSVPHLEGMSHAGYRKVCDLFNATSRTMSKVRETRFRCPGWKMDTPVTEALANSGRFASVVVAVMSCNQNSCRAKLVTMGYVVQFCTVIIWSGDCRVNDYTEMKGRSKVSEREAVEISLDVI
jgi:hypothetical protein